MQRQPSVRALRAIRDAILRRRIGGTRLLAASLLAVFGFGDACAQAPQPQSPPAAAAGSATPAATDPDANLASLSLEQLLQVEVSSASRFDQQASQAPSAVQVITGEQIRLHGWRTLGEALETLPGLYLSDNGIYTYLGARGLLRAGDYDTRFLLLVDGHRINDPVYSQSPVGAEFPLDMALVERIEYVPGPGSALYGSNAFFGVINVRTRAPGSGGSEVAVGAGNFGTRSGRAVLSLQGPLGRSLLAASEIRSDGRDLYSREFASDTSDGVARGLDAEHARKLLLRHSAGDLQVTLLAGERRKDEPVASYEQTFGVPGGNVLDRWAVLGVQYSRALGEATRWQSQLDAIDFRYVGNYVYADEPPTVINRDIDTGRTLVLESRVVTTAIDRHTFVAGVEAQFDRGVEQRNFDVEPRADYLRSRHDGSSVGVFASDEFALRGSWRLNGGLRLDRSDRGKVRLSPRLALVSAPAGGTTVKLIAGSAFRAPNAYERFYEVDTDEGGQHANPDLGAEHIRTAELFLGRNLGPRTRAELSLYDYSLTDLVTLVDDGAGMLTLENRASADSTGAELSLRHYWAEGASVRASYSYSRVRDSAGGEVVNAPSGVARVIAEVPLARGLSLGATGSYMRRRATRAGHVGANAQLHVNLLWQPDGLPMTLSAGVRNLFDARYADPVGPEFVQDAVLRRGRETRVELTWQF
ncbi:TonB-dependent receptor plug domain-containing protein [Luteimonas notoginsengisoli]|uniref:TonB-dependent receptor plug domain-containing protein n=1 Tax=Luteimonas notoginsengisoli TaxID=1578200 RepID=A0ABV7V0G8_9GAMM